MNRILLLFLLVGILINPTTQGQTSFRVMSYNVENLFDTHDNPQTADDEFLPQGNRHWTPGRFYHKIQQLAKVITAAGEWSTPALIGLCEVESDSALIRLLHSTPLKQQQYRYCITHGADPRGINVALLYQRDQFRYLGHHEHPIHFSSKRKKPTRHILHVWGELITKDILHIFVCHLPSRYGGEKESEPNRKDAAQRLRSLCDSVYSLHPTPHILIMGDFNDTPANTSIQEILQAYALSDSTKRVQTTATLSLFHLFPCPNYKSIASHKFQGEWNQIDQIILSGSLLKSTSRIQFKPQSAHIFAPPFLLTKDKTWRGKRPFRSFYGFNYEGGYSDHLPIIADFLLWK